MSGRRAIPLPETLAADYRGGISALQLAAQNGCNIGAILARLRQQGVTIRTRGSSKRPGIVFRRAAKNAGFLSASSAGAMQQRARRQLWISLAEVQRHCDRFFEERGIAATCDVNLFRSAKTFSTQ